VANFPEPLSLRSGRSFPWPLVLAAAGLLLVTSGLCVSCVALSIFADETTAGDRTSWLFCFVLFGIPMVAGGIAAVAYSWRLRRQERERSLHRLVLELAERQGGYIRATDLALHSSLPLDAAQDYLDGLATRGICRMEMAPDGSTFFVFEHSKTSWNTPDE
jgi:predicted transcriptional regulator